MTSENTWKYFTKPKFLAGAPIDHPSAASPIFDEFDGFPWDFPFKQTIRMYK